MSQTTSLFFVVISMGIAGFFLGQIYSRYTNKYKIKKTNRGFGFTKFTDRYNNICSIQMSSLASESCIWFGIDDIKPQILASQAHRLGVKTNETTGWIPFPLPSEVNFNSRMHLTQEQVKNFLPILINFAETGEL